MTEGTTSKRYYGWYIAATLAVTETISWGIIYYAFSVFLTPMGAELNWTRTEMSGAFSLSLLIAGAMAFPVGMWIDRHGARLLMTVGSIAASLLVLAWSQVNSLPALYLIWAGLGVCSAALLYEPAFAVIAVWFVKRRGKALALVTFVAGLASTIFVPLSDALLHAFGWRSAIIILGILLAVTTIPLHLFVLRRRPDDLGLIPDGGMKDSTPLPKQPIGVTLKKVLRSKSFWMLTAGFSLSNLTSAAIRFHFIPYLISVGVNPTTAAAASGSIGILQVLGRVIFAPLDTHISNRVLASCLFGLEAVAILVLLSGSALWNVVGFVLIFGAAYGAKTLARPSMLAEYYGSSHYARISSVMAIFLTLTTTAAPVGASLVYDQTGSYQPVLIGIVCISLTAVSIMVFMKPERSFSQPSLPMVEAADITSA